MPAGSSISVFYFDDVMPGTTTMRLAAAIVWRHAPNTPHRGVQHWKRGPAGWMRELRQRLWLRLGPLGLDVNWRGTRPHDSAVGTVRSVGLIGDEEPRAYYDKRTVRLLGRVYNVPTDGGSLVLLVHEGGGRAGHGRHRDAPRVAVRTVLVPPAATPELPPREPSFDEAAHHSHSDDVRTDAVIGGERAAWETALRADPEVRAFMDADSGA